MLILGLGNRARHGKDSFATAIDSYFAKMDAAAGKHGLKHTPIVIQRLAFADALYKEVNAFLASPYGKRWTEGITGLEIDQRFVIPYWVTPDRPLTDIRAPLGKYPKLLQWWGTEYRRTQDENYWVKQWKAGINPKAHIVLTADMRFLNEAAAVKSAGGFTVQVNRKNIDGTPFVDPTRDSNHLSETQLDGYNFDFQITVKTGDLLLLEEWAITLVHYLRAMKAR